MPSLLVSERRGRLSSSPELLLAFGVFVFFPLVHLYLPRQPDGVFRDAKLRILDAYRERDGLDWSHPKLRLLDLQYHDIQRDRSLYYLLERRGAVERVFTDEEVDALMDNAVEAVLMWSTKDGWPVGVTHAFFWRDGKVWLTFAAHRHRTVAIRRDNRVSVNVSSCGYAPGVGKDLPNGAITFKGTGEFHDDDETKVRTASQYLYWLGMVTLNAGLT